jgi:hypothetical protein
MIFAFLDDRGLMVHDSLEDVLRDHEAIDVENGDVRFFDSEGHSLRAVFTEPNKYTKLLGSIEMVAQGVFTLQPDPESGTSEFCARVLPEVAYLYPNPWFASLEALRESFSSR